MLSMDEGEVKNGRLEKKSRTLYRANGHKNFRGY